MSPRSLLALSLVVVTILGAGALLDGQVFLPPVRRMGWTSSEQGVVPEGTSPFPRVPPDDWPWGPEDARMTFIEYADLQCPQLGGGHLCCIAA